MDFEKRISDIEIRTQNLIDDIHRIKKDYELSKDFTSKLLLECKNTGITKVSICKRHKSLPQSTNFSFGVNGSIFAFQPKKIKDKSVWPPVWGVVKKMGISHGCGNSNQHQIDSSNLVDGVYHLKSGQWKKIN